MLALLFFRCVATVFGHRPAAESPFGTGAGAVSSIDEFRLQWVLSFAIGVKAYLHTAAKTLLDMLSGTTGLHLIEPSDIIWILPWPLASSATCV